MSEQFRQVLNKVEQVYPLQTQRPVSLVSVPSPLKRQVAAWPYDFEIFNLLKTIDDQEELQFIVKRISFVVPMPEHFNTKTFRSKF
jgi:hypothetical protein